MSGETSSADPSPLPRAPAAFVPYRHPQWPWDRPRSFWLVVALSAFYPPAMALTALGALVLLAPSDPCEPETPPGDCGPEYGEIAGISGTILCAATVALLLGWLPRMPTSVRILALAAGLGVIGPLLVQRFS